MASTASEDSKRMKGQSRGNSSLRKPWLFLCIAQASTPSFLLSSQPFPWILMKLTECTCMVIRPSFSLYLAWILSLARPVVVGHRSFVFLSLIALITVVEKAKQKNITTLYNIAILCNTLNILQYFAILWNYLAIWCNTLQYLAIYHNTLQHFAF